MKSAADAGPAPRVRLEQALAQWPQWRCTPPLPGAPHVQGTLPGGLSNHNFLVTAAGRDFVVRIDGISPRQHGLSRQAEYRALASAAAAGIAPGPCYFNPELGALVCQYLPADTAQQVTPADLAALCRRIHRLPRRHHRFDLDARVRRYCSLLERCAKPLPPARLRARIERILPQCQTRNPVLCHNDLLPANLLYSGGRLHALDWEYCAMGNPWFDLAVAGDGQGFSRDDFELFLSAYLQRQPTADDWQQLALQRLGYRYLELLWHLVQAEAEDIHRVSAQRLPPLEALLQADAGHQTSAAPGEPRP
ncbi:phosphotransferase [Seongchinamella sediminis]|uniref:phosphotransferase n=1 Tax=Seongchinamella sediminis TaxID=2283635 RepID=UPI0013C2B5C0|nr:phosphotransferase [Seongchinamella sediminis]